MRFYAIQPNIGPVELYNTLKDNQRPISDAGIPELQIINDRLNASIDPKIIINSINKSVVVTVDSQLIQSNKTIED